MICEGVRSWISGKGKERHRREDTQGGAGHDFKPLAVPLHLRNSRSPAGLLWQGDAVRCRAFHARSTLTKDQILGNAQPGYSGIPRVGGLGAGDFNSLPRGFLMQLS